MITVSKVSEGQVAATNKVTKQNNTTFQAMLDKENGKTASLDAIFEKASKKYNVSVDLLKAIAKAESNFDPNAVSHCGATGIMQLMPSTAKALGVKNSYDPEQNIMGGAKLISQLLKQYNGDVSLALAAYNAGSGNVKKYGGVPPFKETRNYIKKVTSYMNEKVTVPTDKNSVKAKESGSNNTATTTSYTYNSVKPVTANKTYPNSQVTAADYSLADTISDNIFTYEQYLKFLSIYEEIMTDTSLLDNEEEKSVYQNYYSLYSL